MMTSHVRPSLGNAEKLCVTGADGERDITGFHLFNDVHPRIPLRFRFLSDGPSASDAVGANHCASGDFHCPIRPFVPN